MAYDLTISLTGANGDTITFDNTTYTITDGFKGLGIPTTQLRIDSSALDGGIFRYSKRGIRELTMPVVTIGTDRATVETALRRLSNALRNTSGATTLTATYANGDIFNLSVYLAGGGDPVFGTDAGLSWARWVLVFQAANPFWTYATKSSLSIGTGNTGRGLLPQLSKLRVTSSQVFGTITVNNTNGDVPSYPVWTLVGPLDAGVQVLNSSNVGFQYNAAIAAGEIITIDTASRTVVDAAGNNKYANLAPAPKFFTVPPGTSVISVNGTGSSTSTAVTCSFYPRREVVH